MPPETSLAPGHGPGGGWGRLRGRGARWTGVAIVVLVLLPCLLATGVLFWLESTDAALTRFDQRVLEAFVGARQPTLDAVVTVYSDVGNPVPALVTTGLAVIGLSLRWRTPTPVVLMLLGGSGSLALSMTTKRYADRVRPSADLHVNAMEPSWSFPSGHALNATVIAVVLAYLFVSRTGSWRVAAVAVPLAAVHTVLMGLSRVYLGAHWLSDVVVGWAMALAWLVLVLGAHQLLLSRREHRQPVGRGGRDGSPPAAADTLAP